MEMEKVGEILKRSRDLLTAEKPSSKTLDLALGKLLIETAKIYKTETLPGELRLWANLLHGENPQMLEYAFHEHFKASEFPPRPADILNLIRIKRESKFEGTYIPVNKKALEREQSTPEWKESNLKARQTLARIAGKPEPTE